MISQDKNRHFSQISDFFQGSKKSNLSQNQQKKTNLSTKRSSKINPSSKKPSSKKPSSSTKSWGRSLVSLILAPITNRYLRYGSIALITVLILSFAFLIKDLPSARNLTSGDNFPVSTQIFDRNGVLLYEIIGDEHRIPISLDTLPPHVLEATIAIEDQRFYSHFGIDIWGIVRALRNNLRGQPIEGGSTITQQLVKNALLSPERSFDRKIREAVLAVMTEMFYSKDEILEMYLNYISYGGTAVGVEAAAQRYFKIPASELSLAQAALLAGLPQAPSRYSPFGSNPEAAKNRQREVLRRMVEDGYITNAAAEEAMAEVLQYALSTTDIRAPHFVFYVRDQLYEEYGVEMVERGGLRVTTSLDLELHQTAQASLAAEIATLERHRVSNGAAMIIKPDTGEILSMIGSKNYFDAAADGQVNVTLAERQPGSSIKPIMYASAFQEKVLNPGTVLLDLPTCFKIAGQADYCPRNYDGTFRGPVTVRRALGNSLNIPAVRGIATVGMENFINQARAMGITSWQDPSRYGLSLTLGGGEVRMIDMAQAFGVLANQGVKVPLTPILKVTDFRGNVLKEVDINERQDQLRELNLFSHSRLGELERVMDQAPAYLTAHIMQDNNARVEAFGARSELVIPNQVVSVKTGTTNDLKDNWTVGFTPEFLVITWVGNNDNTPMNRAVVSGVTGAAPIFNDLMSFLLRDREPSWQEKPPDVLSAGVCDSGFPPLSGDNCPIRYTELYWEKSRPSDSKVVRREVWFNRDTGLPHQVGESEDNLELREVELFSDPVSSEICIECRRTVDEEGREHYQPIVVE